MSSKTVSRPSDEDASLEGPGAKSAPCDLIDSTYSVLGSFIVDKNDGMEETHTDNDQPEEDDGVDVIDEESVSENQGLLEGVQDLIGSDTGIYPKIHPSTEEQSSTTQIAQSCDSGKSSSSSDTTAMKAGLPKIFAQAPLDMKMNLAFFIISTLLLAGYMQCRIDYFLQECNEFKSESQDKIKAMQDDHNKYKSETQGLFKNIQDDHNKYKSETQGLSQTIQDDHNKYKSETQGIIKTIQDDHNKYKSESQGIIKTIQDDHNKYKLESQDIIKTIQVDLKQEHHKNELLSQKLESMFSRLHQFQHGGSATMSAFIKNEIKKGEDLCPVFVEIMQIAEFFVQREVHSDVIVACGKIIMKCLEDREVKIKLFLESDGLRLLERISAQGQNIDHWGYIMVLLFSRRNEVQCTQEYVGYLLQLLDYFHDEGMAMVASGILCKCLDDDDIWDANTQPTKQHVSESVSRAIQTWKGTYTFGFWYISEASVATWVKQSSATAQQHLAVWILFNFSSTEKKHIINAIGEVILKEILKDPRPHPHTKDLVRKILLE